MAGTTELAKQNNGTGNQVAAQNGTGQVATVIKEAKITNQVQDEIGKLAQGGRLRLPANYSAENALSAAWLTLQDVADKDKKPIVFNGQLTGVVTTRSMVNALMNMVVQGLNPAKKQCYFIVYGEQLTLQRSYFGDMALAERALPGVEFYYDTINEGEEITIEKVRSSRGLYVTAIAKHSQPFPRKEKVLGAYCGAVLDGVDLGADVMDMARILKSWSKSKTAGYDNSTHKVYPGEMAMRTVIRHRCKAIINASDDEMLRDMVDRADNDATEAEVAEDARLHANAETIDVTLREEKQPAKQLAASSKHEAAAEPETGEETANAATQSDEDY